VRKKELRDLLDRVETWPKEAQEAAFDSLSTIEEGGYEDPLLAEDILRSREDMKHGRVTSLDDLRRRLGM
jgi:hypothetical protein